jgi:hypothetical protein
MDCANGGGTGVRPCVHDECCIPSDGSCVGWPCVGIISPSVSTRNDTFNRHKIDLGTVLSDVDDDTQLFKCSLQRPCFEQECCLLASIAPAEDDDFCWWCLLLILLLLCCVPAIWYALKKRQKAPLEEMKSLYKPPVPRPKPKPRPKKVKRKVTATRNSVFDLADEMSGVELTPSILRVTQADLFEHKDVIDAAVNSPLLDAVDDGDYDAVQRILTAGADVGETDKEGETALHHAVKNNDVDMVRLLMLHDADTNFVDDDLESPVQLSVRLKHEECYHAMVDGKMLAPKVEIAFEEEQLDDDARHVVKHWPTVMPAQVHRGGWTFKDANPAATKALQEQMMVKTHLATKGATTNIKNTFTGDIAKGDHAKPSSPALLKRAESRSLLDGIDDDITYEV